MIPSKASFSIKDWSIDDRPREKLMHHGKHNLSDAELLAILIGSGNREESAVALSQRILSASNHNLNALGKLSLKQLMTFKGIGEAKAITIMAALELGKRRSIAEPEKIIVLHSSRDAYLIMQPLIGDLAHEEFWVLYLNNGNKILQKKQMSSGGQTGTVVDIRLLLAKALELGATAMLLAHNHPSGALRPSRADMELTQRIKEAGVLLEIKVHDHIIVTEKAYFSFADEHMM